MSSGALGELKVRMLCCTRGALRVSQGVGRCRKVLTVVLFSIAVESPRILLRSVSCS